LKQSILQGKPDKPFVKPGVPKKPSNLNSSELLKEKQEKLGQSLKDIEELKYKLEVQRSKSDELFLCL
jgi:hypothetical protein